MPRKRALARIALFAAIAFAVTMALLPHPPNLIETNDKANHMLAFATIAALAAWSYPEAELLRIGERLSFLGALIEVLQATPALHRDCDIRDCIADTVAVAVILLLVWSFRRKNRAAT